METVGSPHIPSKHGSWRVPYSIPLERQFSKGFLSYYFLTFNVRLKVVCFKARLEQVNDAPVVDVSPVT